MKQQHKNYLLNVGYQLVMYLFPLVISVYVSRVLGAENLGVYSYVNSIVSMCGMFGMLGIANYGSREVAKSRDNKEALSVIFSSIYTLQLALSGGILLAYVAMVFVFSPEYKSIFLIQCLQLLGVAFDVSWLFFGLEKFKIPLTRNFVIRVLSFVLIVLLVKKPADLFIYSIILGTSSLFGQLCLWALMRKELDFNLSGAKCACAHLKSCAILFIPVLAFSIYRILDKIMLGAMCQKSQLGFYENAEKIVNIPIMVIGALGTVMMPYIAHTSQSSQNLGAEYKRTIRFSMKLSCSLGAFAALGLVVVGRDAAVVLFGEEYLPSGMLVAMLSCTILASAWNNVIRTQYLIPFGIDRPYVRSTMIGAVINFLCNAVFIPSYGAIGACVGTIAAEYSIVLYQTVHAQKQLPIKEFLLDFAASIVKSVITMVVVYFFGAVFSQPLLRLVIRLCIAALLFLILEKKLILIEFFGISHQNKKC